MCPRLKALKDRHLYLPRGCEVPKILKPICEANLDFRQVPMHWDKWVHLIASRLQWSHQRRQRDGTLWFRRARRSTV
jgi:TnpA family transposase